jgi:hypothetical protein
MMPKPDRLRRIAPELFNREGEPDMESDAVSAMVAEVEIHSLLLNRHTAIDGLPDRKALEFAAKELRRLRAECRNRYPADPWRVANFIDDELSRYPKSQ